MKTLKLYFSDLSKSRHQENHKIQKKKREREREKSMFLMTWEETLYPKSLDIFRCHTLYVLGRTL